MTTTAPGWGAVAGILRAAVWRRWAPDEGTGRPTERGRTMADLFGLRVPGSVRSAFRSRDRPATRMDAHFPQFRSFPQCCFAGVVAIDLLPRRGQGVRPGSAGWTLVRSWCWGPLRRVGVLPRRALIVRVVRTSTSRCSVAPSMGVVPGSAAVPPGSTAGPPLAIVAAGSSRPRAFASCGRAPGVSGSFDRVALPCVVNGSSRAGFSCRAFAAASPALPELNLGTCRGQPGGRPSTRWQGGGPKLWGGRSPGPMGQPNFRVRGFGGGSKTLGDGRARPAGSYRSQRREIHWGPSRAFVAPDPW